MFMLIINLRD